MEEPISIQSNSMKIVQVENEENIYICNLQLAENSIEAYIFQTYSSTFKGKINLNQIKNQIRDFIDLNINEIFEEINSLDPSSFSISKDSDKFTLKIKINIFRKEKYLLIDLEENKNMNVTNSDLINYYEKIINGKDKMILKLNGIIERKNAEIKMIKKQIKNNKYYNDKISEEDLKILI